MTGVGEGELARGGVKDRRDQRDEHVLGVVGSNEVVHLIEGDGGVVAVHELLVQQRQHHRHEERRAHALAGHVRDHAQHAAIAEKSQVIEVAAHGARGPLEREGVEAVARELAHGRNEAELDAAGHVELGGGARLLVGHLADVLDEDFDVVGHLVEGRLDAGDLGGLADGLLVSGVHAVLNEAAHARGELLQGVRHVALDGQEAEEDDEADDDRERNREGEGVAHDLGALVVRVEEDAKHVDLVAALQLDGEVPANRGAQRRRAYEVGGVGEAVAGCREHLLRHALHVAAVRPLTWKLRVNLLVDRGALDGRGRRCVGVDVVDGKHLAVHGDAEVAELALEEGERLLVQVRGLARGRASRGRHGRLA